MKTLLIATLALSVFSVTCFAGGGFDGNGGKGGRRVENCGSTSNETEPTGIDHN